MLRWHDEKGGGGELLEMSEDNSVAFQNKLAFHSVSEREDGKEGIRS